MRALFSLVAVFFLLPIATLSATQQLLETEDGKHYLLQTSNRKKGPSTSLPQTRSRSDDYFDLRRWVRRGNQKVRYDKNMSLHCQGPLGVHGMACTRCIVQLQMNYNSPLKLSFTLIEAARTSMLGGAALENVWILEIGLGELLCSK